MRWIGCSLLIMGCTPETVSGPLEGPGFDENTGALTAEGDTFIVGLTHLQVRNAPGPGKRFGDHAEAIATDLFTSEPEGFVGVAFRNRGQLQWWTLSVWTDEASLTSFVVSDLHVAAMLDFNDITTGGLTRVLTMQADELPLSWDRALTLLASDPSFEQGKSRWPERP